MTDDRAHASPAATPEAEAPDAGDERSFSFDDMRGVVAASAVDGELDGDFEAKLHRILDPAAARRTLHWGRSYLHESVWTMAGERETAVVVKQFRHDDLRARLRRRRRGSRALLSFETARHLLRLGIATPEPLLFAESKTVDGPAWFVSRLVPDALELRYVLRALNAGVMADRFPEIDGSALLLRVGALAGELHRHGVWFRDLTPGNVLLSRPTDDAELFLVDVNRARFKRRLSTGQRLRDICRMPVLHRPDRSVYLAGYRPGGLGRLRRTWFEICHHAFRLKIRSKQGARSGMRRLADLLLPRRRAHHHVADADRNAPATEKAVWDPLTDQPHQQATRGQRLRVRARDLGEHVGPLVGAVGPLVGSLVEARRTRRRLDRAAPSVRFDGLGVAVGSGSVPTESLVAAIRDLGVDTALLRFHLWQGVDRNLLELARELGDGERRLDLVFHLAQDRSLVRDVDAWRERVAEAVALLAPFGLRFLIGQAPNRSKWGIWRPREYRDLLAAGAAAVREGCPEATILAPAVIDFEPHATAGLIHTGQAPNRFDVLASQLYVDRRGAPENRQLGFDLVGKLAVLGALARRAPDCSSGRSWVTEFNWPLREGPHSPAGRDVAVDEDAQASYLVRYALEALGSGLTERVYWWQLAAAGYGLLDPRGAGLRRRPAYLALRQLQRELGGALVRRLPMPDGLRACSGRLPGREIRVVWSVDGRPTSWRPPDRVRAVRDRDGVELDRVPSSPGAAPTYLELESQDARSRCLR